MQIVNCTLSDLDSMMELYHQASEYQKANGYNEWKEFDRDLVIREIDEKRQWKIMIDGQIACIFLVAYSDPYLWGERDNPYSIYLHRITTNKAFKGRSMMQLIIDWSKKHIIENGRKFIRMDTWADNKNLIDYYMKYGFESAGIRQLDKDTKGLPKHYSTLSLALLEMKA